MAKTMYQGVSGVARKVKQPYQGVGGVARKVKNGYVGVGGVARQFYSGSVTLGSLPVGTTVKATYNNGYSSNSGTVEFIVVHQGQPSADYSGFTDGTCLWLKYALPVLYNEYHVYGHTTYDIGDGDGGYYKVGASDYNEWGCHGRLNNYNVNFFNISSIMKTVSIPYAAPDLDEYEDEYGPQYTINRWKNSISGKLFVLSLTEMGINGDYAPYEGAKFDYFLASNTTEAKNLRKFQASSGSSTYYDYWSRSASGDIFAFPIRTTGYYTGTVSVAEWSDDTEDYVSVNTFLPRFACVLPSTTLVDDSFNIIVES